MRPTVRLTAVLVAATLAVAPAVTAPALADPGNRTLRSGEPREAGLLKEYVDRIVEDTRAGLLPDPATGRPLYPGAVVLAARRGVVVTHEAVGSALRYADQGGTELPPDQWIPMRDDTIFDMASISKLFTAVVAMQLVEAGRLDLDAPVARYIPEFAANGKGEVTLRQVLTHISGLPAGLNVSSYPTIDERLAAIYAVRPVAPAGTRYVYSDLSLIVVGKVVERLTGQPLDRLVAERISRPLGLRDTMHNPPAYLRERIAPTEWQPGGRGLVWGEVHDSTSWHLGGTAGHAGVFSTAHDLAVFAQMLLNGGRYGRARILSEGAVRAMLTNYNTAFPGADRGLGFDLNKYSFMGAMTTPGTAGHTGFTGTSLVLDPAAQSFVILLTNKVHPHRSWSDVGSARRMVATDLARALPVRPAEGRSAWFSGLGDNRTATLTLPLQVPPDGARLSFAYWWDTEPGHDLATLERSIDDGASWQPVPLRLDGTSSDGVVSGYQGRRWVDASADLPSAAHATLLRWRYATDAQYGGRGVYVDAVRVTDHRGHPVFDDSRPADAARWQPLGWAPSTD
jgi:CubicO group peptidase (beta-lactamase class C family)